MKNSHLNDDDITICIIIQKYIHMSILYCFRRLLFDHRKSIALDKSFVWKIVSVNENNNYITSEN